MRFSRPHPLTLFLPTLLLGGAYAQAQPDVVTLETIVVTGNSDQSVFDTARPVTVLGADAIDENPGSNLGTLLESQPGVANAAFGAGVGRPVIRGMSGSRVKILQNGSDTADLSAMSSDHSPMAEPTAAEQVEIIYGPSTLLYGGGAIGGVVNVIDRRIHETIIPGLHGEAGTRYSTVDTGYQAEAIMDAASETWVLHLDGFRREADNYQASGGEEIENSDTEGSGGAIGLSWADGTNGFIGGSISTLSYDYAVPNPDDEFFRVKPDQIRYDLKGAWTPSSGWVESWRTELSFNDYEHDETGPRNDVVGAPEVAIGLFDQETYELTSKIRHMPLADWEGEFGVQVVRQDLALCHDHGGCDNIPSFSDDWDGNMGFDLANADSNGYLFAHDTPVPLTESTKTGAFVVERLDWGPGIVELGARIDHIRIAADPRSVDPIWRQDQSYYDDRTFTPLSLSAAHTWKLSDDQRLGLSLARVQRAPEVPEMYWNGDHHATFAFQLDNPDLGLETAWTLDLNWMMQTEKHQLRLAAYHYDFSDYIYNDLKAFQDPYHLNNVYRHEQRDARFTGGEVSWKYQLQDQWRTDLSADIVKARLTDGGNLPRTPPASLLAGIEWEPSKWHARIETRMVAEQTDTADNETRTDGYVMFNAKVGYETELGDSTLDLHMDLNNLTDQEAYNHVSYLKDAAPLAGRDVRLHARITF